MLLGGGQRSYPVTCRWLWPKTRLVLVHTIRDQEVPIVKKKKSYELQCVLSSQRKELWELLEPIK